MKIAPAIPAPPSPGGSPLSPLTGSFTAMLNTLTAPHQVETFDALGMFGRHGAVTEQSSGESPVAVDALSTPAPLSAAPPEPDISQPGHSISPVPDNHFATYPGGIVIRCERVVERPRPDPAARQSVGLSSSSALGTTFRTEDTPLIVEPGRTAPPSAPKAAISRVHPHLRLETTSLTHAAVSVVGAALTPEDAERFRSRAEQLLLEHGLSLRTITFTGGSSVSADFARINRPWR